MRVNGYQIINGTADHVTAQVNALIVKGWQPYGSPTVLPPTPELAEQVDMVFQAMVRPAAGEEAIE